MKKLPANDPRWSEIEDFLEQGLMERTDTYLRISDQGLFVADSVIGPTLVVD